MSDRNQPPPPGEPPNSTARGKLRVIDSGPEPTALSARWPDVIGDLEETDRDARVRTGIDTVLLDDPSDPDLRRGFVRAVLRVPLDHEDGQVYGVFVEVDRKAYADLKRAYAEKTPTRVWGKLANRLPLLTDAFGSDVCIVEDGSDRRARVVEAKHDLLRSGPAVGPWANES